MSCDNSNSVIQIVDRDARGGLEQQGIASKDAAEK